MKESGIGKIAEDSGSVALICTVANRVIIDCLREATAKKRTPENGKIISNQGASSMVLPMVQGNVETPSKILMRDEAGVVVWRVADQVLSEQQKLIFYLKHG